MAELTAGYVAGLINLGIFIGETPAYRENKTSADLESHLPVQAFSPTAINFILVGVLRDRETAATWCLIVTPNCVFWCGGLYSFPGQWSAGLFRALTGPSSYGLTQYGAMVSGKRSSG